MGQRIGKASFEEDAKPFLNLPAHAINSVWTTFNLSAEGWGLRLVDFVGVCAPLGNVLGLDDPAMQLKAEAMFALLDTDGNGIVDALEFMATLVRSPLPWFLSSRSEGVTGQGSEWRFCVLLLMVVVVVVMVVVVLGMGGDASNADGADVKRKNSNRSAQMLTVSPPFLCTSLGPGLPACPPACLPDSTPPCLLACQGMLSAMDMPDKMRFVFTVYDFGESGTLLADEVTLAVKSTVEGLCKVSKLPPPSIAECEVNQK